MRKIVLAFTAAASAAVISLSFSAPAQAQYCEGTVNGLSGYYNPATGAGFLAIRAKPRATSHQRGELFNGDKVEVFQRKGNWYRIATADAPMIEGWVHKRWLYNECNY